MGLTAFGVVAVAVAVLVGLGLVTGDAATASSFGL